MSLDSPAISVVIPSYRGGAYLREAVQSVVSQTFTDWEIVIVLDGCDDNTDDLTRNHRVRVIRQKNRGVSIARNVAIANAKGRFIAFLDDDDRMLAKRLEVQYEALRDDDSADLCHSQFQFIDEKGNVKGRGASRNSQYADFLRSKGGLLFSTALVRKSALNAVGGFNPLFSTSEDMDLVYRIARTSTLVFTPETLYEYRIHGQNAWLSQSTTGDDMALKLVLAAHRIAATTGGETENLRAIKEGLRHALPVRADLALRGAREAVTTRKYGKAAVALLRAFLIAPGPVVRVLARGRRHEI